MTLKKNEAVEDIIGKGVRIRPDLTQMSVKELIELSDACCKEIVLKMKMEHKTKRTKN